MRGDNNDNDGRAREIIMIVKNNSMFFMMIHMAMLPIMMPMTVVVVKSF